CVPATSDPRHARRLRAGQPGPCRGARSAEGSWYTVCERVSDDLELLAAWRDGDAAAGGRLFRRHFDTLFRFFSTKLDGPVEDLVQDTFLGCVRGRDRF